MKIMAIDYGDAHTGVAISDRTLTLTGFSTVITAYRPEASSKAAAAHLRARGLRARARPPTQHGRHARPPRRKGRGLCEMLREATSLPVTLWDERRTTVDAHNILLNNGKRAKERKKNRRRRRGEPDA